LRFTGDFAPEESIKINQNPPAKPKISLAHSGKGVLLSPHFLFPELLLGWIIYDRPAAGTSINDGNLGQ
jgi:hypothetical protein